MIALSGVVHFISPPPSQKQVTLFYKYLSYNSWKKHKVNSDESLK